MLPFAVIASPLVEETYESVICGGWWVSRAVSEDVVDDSERDRERNTHFYVGRKSKRREGVLVGGRRETERRLLRLRLFAAACRVVQSHRLQPSLGQQHLVLPAILITMLRFFYVYISPLTQGPT